MTPAYRVTVDGRDISDAVRERLVSLEVADRSGLIADTLTLRLDDSDGLLALPRRAWRCRWRWAMTRRASWTWASSSSMRSARGGRGMR